MNRYVFNCKKCKKAFVRGTRRKLSIMREHVDASFVTDGFSVYLCPLCAEEIMEEIARWCG